MTFDSIPLFSRYPVLPFMFLTMSVETSPLVFTWRQIYPFLYSTVPVPLLILYFTMSKVFLRTKDSSTGFRWRLGSWGPPGKLQNFKNWSTLTNSRRRYMAEILPIQRNTLSYQSINCVLPVSSFIHYTMFRVSLFSLHDDHCLHSSISGCAVSPFLISKMTSSSILFLYFKTHSASISLVYAEHAMINVFIPLFYGD